MSGSNIVESWLDRIGLGYVIEKCRLYGITTPEELIRLTFEDYDKLGIENVMHRRSLFELINKVKTAYSQKIAEDEEESHQQGDGTEEYPADEDEEEEMATDDVYEMPVPGGGLGPDRRVKKKIGKPRGKGKRPKITPSIQVVVRKRPLSHKEHLQGAQDVVQSTERIVYVQAPKQKVDLTKYVETHEYAYDRSFGETATTEEIYNSTAKHLVDAVFEGSKATCFAYGQTGSGKTFTMLGGTATDQENGNAGLYLLAARDIFAKLHEPQYRHLTLMVSFFEIYGGKIFDLLNDRKRLKSLEDAKRNVVIVGLQNHIVSDSRSLINLIYYGIEARSMGSTGANLDSSRSHAVLQLALVDNKRGKEHGRFSFIDLAGSERGADTVHADRVTRQEGAEINKSLLALKECIRAMYNTNHYMPFRGSQLTQVLKDSLIGNCSTLMIATVSPSSENVEHTLNTLRYAHRVKEINATDIAKVAIKRAQQHTRVQRYPRENYDYGEEYPGQDGDFEEEDLDGEGIDEIEEDLMSTPAGPGQLQAPKLSASQVYQTRVSNSPQNSSLGLSELIAEYINNHSSQIDLLLTIINDEMQVIKSLESSTLEDEIEANAETIETMLDKKIAILTELKENLDSLRQNSKRFF